MTNNNKYKPTCSDPSAHNYAEEVKNQANQNTPFGKTEPSTSTTYK